MKVYLFSRVSGPILDLGEQSCIPRIGEVVRIEDQQRKVSLYEVKEVQHEFSFKLDPEDKARDRFTSDGVKVIVNKIF